jgi:hypothetical protein
VRGLPEIMRARHATRVRQEPGRPYHLRPENPVRGHWVNKVPGPTGEHASGRDAKTASRRYRVARQRADRDGR